MKATTSIVASSAEEVVGTSSSSCTDIPAIHTTNDTMVSSLVALLESSARRGDSLITLQRVFEHILHKDDDKSHLNSSSSSSSRLELLIALLPQLVRVASELKEHQHTQHEPSSSSSSPNTKTALLLASILLHLLPDEEEEEGQTNTRSLFTPTVANQLRTCLQQGCLPFAVIPTDLQVEDNHSTNAQQQQGGREERRLAIVLLSIFSLAIPLFRSATTHDGYHDWMLPATLTLVQAHGLAAAVLAEDEPTRTITTAFFTDHVNVLVLGCSIWGHLVLTDQRNKEEEEQGESTPRGRPTCQRRRNEDETNSSNTLLSSSTTMASTTTTTSFSSSSNINDSSHDSLSLLPILHCLLDNIIAAQQWATSSSPDFTAGSSSSFCCWSLLQQLVGSPQAAHELLQQALVWKGYHRGHSEGAARGSCWVYGTAAAAA